MSSLKEEIRSKLKREFEIQLNRLTTSTYFIAKLDEFGLKGFKYEVMSDKHKDGVLELLGSQITGEGGNTLSGIFNISETDKEAYNRFSHLIDHAIKTGLSYVVIDTNKNKNNLIVSMCLLFDILDKPPYGDWSKYHTKYSKRADISKYSTLNHTFFTSLAENIKYGLIKQGECIEFAQGASHRDYQSISRGMHYMFMPSYVLAFSLQSVKYLMVKASHPATVKILYKYDHYFNALNEEKDIAFYSDLSDLKEFIINKIKNDEWYKNNIDQQYVMKHINKLTAASQVVCFEKLRKKYDLKQFFLHYITALTLKSKL